MATATAVRTHDLTHHVYCNCNHTGCEELKDQFFCNRWFFFRCGGIVPQEPGTVLTYLRAFLNASDDKAPFYGVRTAAGTLCFLVRLGLPRREGTGLFDGMNWLVNDLADRFDITASLTPLGCCAELVHCNARDWIATWERLDIVSDFGDSSLCVTFQDDVRPYLANKCYL